MEYGKTFSRCACFFLFFVVLAAGAAEIKIVKTGAVRSNIDMHNFKNDGSKSSIIFEKTLRNDLERWGWFKVVDGGAGIQLSGQCAEDKGINRVTCSVRGGSTRYLNKTFRGKAEDADELAHEVADRIVEAVKGVPGVASARIAMVGVRGGKKDLYLCNSDGSGFVQLTRDGAVCVAPSWSPDGKTLAYTSFHGGFPDIYLIDLSSHRRKKLMSYPGLNLGASISADGRFLAAVLSKDGNPELYVMKMDNRKLRRLTRTANAVETSPSWSPEGKEIVYVADESGLPQIYIMDSSGGGKRRLTYRGSQNVAPDWGPGGEIVYSSKRGRHYQICLKDSEGGKSRVLTDGNADHEDPSWAADGRHIVYTRTVGYRSNLYILDTMGGAPLRLTRVKGDWHSPTWSPR